MWKKGEYEELFDEGLGDLSKKFFPSSKEVGVYKSVEFYVGEGRFFDVAEFVWCLELVYDEENYYEQIDVINKKYIFLKNAIQNDRVFDIPVAECYLGDYHIKLVDESKYLEEIHFQYPQYFSFIAFHKSTHTIRYCASKQISLDYFESEKDFKEFLCNSFTMKW